MLWSASVASRKHSKSSVWGGIAFAVGPPDRGVLSGWARAMIERTRTGIVDVLDHVLDKGVVIDAWVNVSLVGIELVTVEARVVVASIPTYMRYAAIMSHLEPVARSAHPDRRFRANPEERTRPSRRPPFRAETVHMMRRRAEDRVVDELHDARARTVRKITKR